MRRLVFLSLALAAILGHAAPNPDAEPTLFTAKELAQGYRDHVIIARPHASHRARADAEEAREGFRVRQKFSRFGDMRIIDLDATDATDSAIARLRATGRYDFVEPDYIVHASVEPNDPRFTDGSLWALKNTGAVNGIAGADIHATAAWDIVHDAPGVVVAVVDTGVNLTHLDIVQNLWTNPAPTAGDVHGANFVGGFGQMVSGNPADNNGHGTHVAGTIGATGNNGLGSTGVAWRVQIMAVKVLGSNGSGGISDIVAGINYAVAHGANIINASYGGDANTGFSEAQLTAIAAARDAGVVFVAAAGNSSADMDVARFYPASYALDNIVTVGASGRRDEWASFSNYGAAIDLFAPGSDITSLDYATTSGTISLSGTSMAAPHVAGALALLKAQFPTDNYRQLINRLLRGADPVSALTTRAQSGGRLNLLGALTSGSNRPFNDDFARRPRLGGSNLSIRTSNAGATAEPGEPAHGGAGPSASLWWEWTAPTSGTVSLDTSGSTYDTVLAVYTAPDAAALNSPGTLTPVAANDNVTGTDTTSRVTFTATAGTAYEFAVDGKPGQSGLTLLNLGTTAANDLFASPVMLLGSSTHLTATNAHASREADEPHVLGWPGGLSLWYRWTAPRSGHFQVSVVSGDFDPILGVYTGGSLSTLTSVAEGDNSGPNNSDTGAICSFDATAGTTYSIMVDGHTAANAGQFTLSLVDSLWQAATTNSVTGSAAVAADGTVYIGSTDRSLYAFAPDGTQKWSFATGGIIDTCSPAIAEDGTVYVSSNDGRFYALSPSGTAKWTHDFGSAAPISNSPALAADGTIYVKVGDGYLYALKPADGSVKWSRNVLAPTSYASPSVAADGTIYQGSENGLLYALNPADGSVKWTYLAGDDIYSVPAIDAAGNIYVTVLNTGKLHCISPNGVARWVYAGAAASSSSSPALSADGGTVYFAAYDKKLHAVNTATGVARWTYPLGDEVRASSPAVDANGIVYIGCYDFKLYAVNADGTLKRTWDMGNWLRSAPTIAGNTLYVGSNDHKLYALDVGTGSAAGAWPQYRHDARRLGRALPPPSFTAQPASQSARLGASVTFNAAATGAIAPTYQWQHNGRNIAGATGATLTLDNVQPADAGVYTAIAASGVPVPSAPAILGVLSDAKVAGAGVQLEPHDIVHPVTGYTYDQVLLTGSAATITADPGQITRMSYIDLSDDIVQVEFSGPGALTLVLDNATGPAQPLNYTQNVAYMKGHATVVIAGATATTHTAIFSVGRANAVDQSLFRSGVAYDGIADVALLAIASVDGKFGGVHTGNASYWATRGLTGLYAPGVQFTDAVNLGDIGATDDASPVLLLGSATAVNITGGDLLQSNNRAVQVSGVGQLRFVAGTTSHNDLLPAQTNKGRLEQNGADVTAQIVVNPAP